ncbi:MAG: LPS assembly protein LptD [Thiohalocapsa sp.]|uniref:LPS-assembly protein LptD n=1 Tax=Thiohalocapsa sp. TaxID=2497641 RepID=UPI0025FDB9BD|nr:LPS assembly protein LptD [Thiohalocapsa sp.]MCG6942225.1 LPS assembly protein LptD [Thiohalocapsa sp.]
MSSTYRRNALSCTLAIAGSLLLPPPAAIAAEAPPQPQTQPAATPEVLPAPGPAELPPVPNLLDTLPQIQAPASPFRLPAMTTPALPDMSPVLGPGMSPGKNLDTAPAAEPLWVLPPSVIPEHIPSVPGAEPVRSRGYLDRPKNVVGVVNEPIEPNSDKLERGLEWAYCGPRPPYLGPGSTETPAAEAADIEQAPTDITAGGVTYRRKRDVVEAVGGVTVVRGPERVEADTLRYDRRQDIVTTTGPTYLQYPELRIAGTGATVNMATEQGRVDAPRFRLSGPLNARGVAQTAYLVSSTRTAYRDIIYTTCPPGSNAWTLRANKLKLDQYSGLGIARDASLRIRGVPVLYAPYLQFPIDDRRRSGFLVPSIGSSDSNGFEVRTPYYWNIAPNMDATITPRIMSKRGVMLGTQYRYLTRPDRGEIHAEILPDDRAYNGKDKLRWAFNMLEEGHWLGRLRTRIDYTAVSDDTYLEDLGNDIDATSTRWLRQRGDVTYTGQGWSLLTRMEGFQTLDQTVSPENRPYGRLPQVLFHVAPAQLLPSTTSRWVGKPTIGLDAEYDYFDHDHRVHGQRMTMTPLLSWPLRRSWGHLIPGARLYFSQYDLVETSPGDPATPSNSIPSLDLDGKLIFERPAHWLGEQAVQTLEPRAYYLYTPYVDQTEIPVFDSSELDFSFANLFRNNRFTGRDRIGDANQITAGISSRMLRAATGEELFRVSVGQVYYFANRQVQISGPPQTESTSPYIGELSAQIFAHWFGRASFQWDPNTDGDPAPQRTLRLEYRDPERRVLNLAYRTDLTTAVDNRYEDADVSFRLPFGARAEMVGRWLYSVRHGETMDAVAGVTFGKCCWRLSILGRHFKRQPDAPATTSVMLQLELAGLGAVGEPIGEFLEREIYGYASY